MIISFKDITMPYMAYVTSNPNIILIYTFSTLVDRVLLNHDRQYDLVLAVRKHINRIIRERRNNHVNIYLNELQHEKVIW